MLPSPPPRPETTDERTPAEDITFRSEMTVQLIKHAARDADVIWAARA